MRRQLKSFIKMQPPSVYIFTSLYKIVTNYWRFWHKLPRTPPIAKCSHRVGRKCETTFHTLIFLHVRLSQSESLWAGQHVCVHLANLTLLFFFVWLIQKGHMRALGFGEKRVLWGLSLFRGLCIQWEGFFCEWHTGTLACVQLVLLAPRAWTLDVLTRLLITGSHPH